VRPPADWPDYDLTKAEYLQRFDPKAILIDDSPENVAGAKKAGVPALLFPQPWNEAGHSLDELLQQLTSRGA
jgi:FMN phosphatase YigB (HAD superfamily)